MTGNRVRAETVESPRGSVGEVQPQRCWRRGFTLVELLVVMAIISVLAAMLLPVLSRARKAAQMSDCANRQKQLWTVSIMYADEGNGYTPPIIVKNAQCT